MGNFLVIVSSVDVHTQANHLFRSGLEFARRIKLQVPSKMAEMRWVRAASFPRHNGSGAPIVFHPGTGSWLLAIGTWFHAHDYGMGDEARLLQRYFEVGSDQLTRELEGFFAIVVADARTREAIVLTDIVGSCHCFVRSWGNIIAVSGSSSLLASLEDFGLDPVSCQEFLSTGIIYEDRTIYREVRKLLPATVYRLAEGTLKAEKRYWQITDIAPESLDGQAATGALWEALVHAARRIGRTFGRPVCDLTGGHDTRAVVAAFVAAQVQVSTTVSGLASSPDVIVSRRVAQIAGLPHLHVEPKGHVSFDQVKKAFGLTDGEYDLVEYARILEIHQTLSERFDISINGSFGEIARGYWWELLFPRAGASYKLNAERIARLRYAAQKYDPSLFPPEMCLDLVSHFTGILERTNAELSCLPNTAQMDHAYLTMRMQRWQGRIASSTNQLWPCLSPYIFRSVLETMLRITVRLRRRSLLIRQMLAEFQPRLAELPLEYGYPALPVTWKNIYRFWPVPAHYGRKILSKVLPKGDERHASADSTSRYLPTSALLWQEDEVRELLSPARMRLACMLDTGALGDFLKRSHQPGFLFNDQWTRLLSLEYTLRVLEEMKVAALT